MPSLLAPTLLCSVQYSSATCIPEQRRSGVRQLLLSPTPALFRMCLCVIVHLNRAYSTHCNPLQHSYVHAQKKEDTRQ
jgi:hypothetical protein